MSPEELVRCVESVLLGAEGPRRGDGVVVAVSGGVDSTVLLDVLHHLSGDQDLRLHVAHLDHQLRLESVGDARSVASAAAARGLPFFGQSADVTGHARGRGLSVEMAARELRFRFLDDVMRRTGSSRIALGHHADDQAETVLLRLLRGSGSRGLGGMRLLRDGRYLRPLLAVRKDDIATYAGARALPFREDESNRDRAFLRNRVRHELIPYLREHYNPEISAALGRTSSLLAAEDSQLAQISQEAVETVVCERSPGKIVLAARLLVDYHIAIQRRILRSVMLELLRTNGVADGRDAVEFSHVEAVTQILRRQSPKLGRLPGLLNVQLTGDRLIFRRRIPYPELDIDIRIPGRTEVPERGIILQSRLLPATAFPRVRPLLGGWRVAFDADAAKGLGLRSHRPGDRLQPLGMTGHKKVSHLLVDAKRPRIDRDDVVVLARGKEIAWVGGICLGDGFKVRPDSQHLVYLELSTSFGGRNEMCDG
jgi:tRNA(Ile)-lysidine synthase